MKTLMMIIGFWCFSLWAAPTKQVLPLNSTIQVNGSHAEITLKAKADISELEVISVKGLDGLKILSSQLPDKQDVKAGETIIVSVEIQRPAGRVYLSLNVKSKKRMQNLNFALGEVSAKQRVKKSTAVQTVNGKKRHILKIEEKK